MPEIKLFSIVDLRNWLENNQPVEGLSDAVISPSRAYAILHNPYVKDDDHVVATIYDHGELAAYTAAFPEILHYPQSTIAGTAHNPQRIWWFSTLYCAPKSRGKGYGLIVIGSLAEEYGIENCYDMWGAQETVEIFRMLGLKDITIPQYEFGPKSIHRGSIKGKLAYVAQQMQLAFKTRRKVLLKITKQTPFEQQYTTHIDDETYSFIVAHADRDAFLRSRNMLNWILRCPFVRVTADAGTAPKRTEFPDVATEYTISCVRVLVDSKLVGVYILRVNATQMAVKYLYYDTQYQNMVFAAIGSNLLKYNKLLFETRNKALAEFVELYHLFPKNAQIPISFSYPEGAGIDLSKQFQAESDNFV